MKKRHEINKWIIYLSSVFLFAGCSGENEKKKELELINIEIQTLDAQLHTLRMKEMKEDVNAQETMIANWPAFAKDTEQLKQDEDKEKQIQAHIKQLEERKAQLLQK